MTAVIIINPIQTVSQIIPLAFLFIILASDAKYRIIFLLVIIYNSFLFNSPFNIYYIILK